MMNINSEPMQAGGDNHETHHWEPVSDDTIVIEGAKRFYAIALCYLAVGLLLFILGSIALLLEGFSFTLLIMSVAGALGIAYGLKCYRACNQKIVINRQTGVVRVRQWGRIKLDSLKGIAMEVPRDQISAIQELRHTIRVHGPKGRPMDFYQYQVNIVRSDNERENIMLSVDEFKADRASRGIARILDVEHVQTPDASVRNPPPKERRTINIHNTTTDRSFK